MYNLTDMEDGFYINETQGWGELLGSRAFLWRLH
jgi:hypothetical protein